MSRAAGLDRVSHTTVGMKITTLARSFRNARLAAQVALRENRALFLGDADDDGGTYLLPVSNRAGGQLRRGGYEELAREVVVRLGAA